MTNDAPASGRMAVASQWQLLRDSTCRSNRFHKHRRFIRNRIGHTMEIDLRDQHTVGKCSIMSHDSNHRAVRAMIAQTLSTQWTDATRTVDLSDNALPGELAAASDPDKLMPQNSAESHVALTELQIGFTNARSGHIDDDFARLRRSQLGLRIELQALVKNNSSHRSSLVHTGLCTTYSTTSAEL